MTLFITLDDLIGIISVGIVVAIAIAVACGQVMCQRRCPHRRIAETQACDAICSDCGKNLGFIGAWRVRTAAQPNGGTND